MYFFIFLHTLNRLSGQVPSSNSCLLVNTLIMQICCAATFDILHIWLSSTDDQRNGNPEILNPDHLILAPLENYEQLFFYSRPCSCIDLSRSVSALLFDLLSNDWHCCLCSGSEDQWVRGFEVLWCHPKRQHISCSDQLQREQHSGPDVSTPILVVGTISAPFTVKT